MKRSTKKLFSFFLFSLLLTTNLSNAQPFRYIYTDNSKRDSVKLFKIKSFKEFQSPINDEKNKTLAGISEFDKNGNLIRIWKMDLVSNTQYQWRYLYDENNRLLEFAVYFKDSITLSYKVIHSYDQNGNELKIITENYTDGIFKNSTRTENTYDIKNHLTHIRGFNSKNEMISHYEYIYDAYGRRIEEKRYYENDKKFYSIKLNGIQTEELDPYGTPEDETDEMKELKKQTLTYNGDLTIVEDVYAIRTFNKQNLLLKWVEKNHRIHWFKYSYYK